MRALKPADLPLTRRLTLALETAVPACVTLPVNFTSRLAALTFLASVTVPSATNARVSTVPATLGAPVPAAYGVVIAFQMLCPAGTVKMLSTVNVASRSRAPFGERPGVPTGTSSGARHTTSLYVPSAASAPASWSTCTGKLMLCPATERARFQTARCGTGSQVGASELAETTTSPDSGSGMFASRENTVPVVDPIFVPGAAEALIE